MTKPTNVDAYVDSIMIITDQKRLLSEFLQISALNKTISWNVANLSIGHNRTKVKKLCMPWII